MDCQVTAVVLTLNEAEHLPGCLKSLGWADAILVVDSGSTDRTPEVAAEFGTRLVTRSFTNFADQRNWALGLVTTPWVFFVDADERVPPALAEEIQRATAGPCVGYWIPRQNLILGRWVRGGGWWPDYQLRLFKTDRGRYDPAWPVHEVLQIEGPVGRLENPLVHLNYSTVGEIFAKQRRYARLEALRLYRQGVRPRPHRFFTFPLREFHRRFLRLRGYRDGWVGLVLAAALAWQAVIVLRELGQLGRG
ncbi:MAG: glycosyltransferase family 2 protein [Chloroflexota bacterium]|mgnify:CR=1 FL=1